MHMFGGFWIDVIIGFVAGLIVAVVLYLINNDLTADTESRACPTDSVDAAAVR
ncbi:hypothetical protein [Mycolicibacillus trivialis]|uniref:hypothetical protein n=2 Tax=Mycolicibacillus trivialis TaxID=1798 RepID=UPI0013FD3C1F|nr:hypothetical protein [Mycolicibacillus trivialis]